jgi:hypothetical protein
MQKSVEQLLSRKRLDSYQGKNNNDLQTQLHRYNYNIELSQSFYAPLHLLEISLRNSLAIELQKYLNDPNWPVNYLSHPIFQTREKEKIQESLDELNKRNKPLEIGRIIAELNLGFWINLYDRPYLEFQKHTIKDQFPFATNRQRNIFSIKQKLNDIRVLRNRVFHYEPIWHWSNLEEHFNEIKELLSWMNLDILLKSFVESENNFNLQLSRQEKLLK